MDKKQNKSNLNNKNIVTITKIISVIAFVVICLIAGLYLFESFSGKEPSYFSVHFAIPIIMFILGVLAILLPKVNGTKYLSNAQGDKMMPVVGVLLILCSLATLLMSYLV